MTEHGISVECPHCNERFATHDVGDLVACKGCDKLFERFTNMVHGEETCDYHDCPNDAVQHYESPTGRVFNRCETHRVAEDLEPPF